jgi:hypothetical protein
MSSDLNCGGKHQLLDNHSDRELCVICDPYNKKDPQKPIIIPFKNYSISILKLKLQNILKTFLQ